MDALAEVGSGGPSNFSFGRHKHARTRLVTIRLVDERLAAEGRSPEHRDIVRLAAAAQRELHFCRRRFFRVRALVIRWRSRWARTQSLPAHAFHGALSQWLGREVLVGKYVSNTRGDRRRRLPRLWFPPRAAIVPAARSTRREARAANPKALRPMIGGELASTQELEQMMDAPSVELKHGDPSGDLPSNDAELGDEPSDDVSQQSSEDSAAEREGEIVKLAAFALGSGGRARWCGQLRAA